MTGSDEGDHVVTLRVTPLRKEIRLLLALAWPLVAAQLANVAMGATDAVYLGDLGPEAIAAGGLAASIHVTVQIVASGFLTVLAPLLAEAWARRDLARVASVARHGLLIAVVLAIVAVGVVRSAALGLVVVGASEAVVAIVGPFARAVAWATPFALASSVLRHLLSAAGRPRTITIAAVVGASVNLGLDAVLTRSMGPTGVGIATVVAQASSCLVLLVAAARLVAPTAVLRAEHDGALVREIVALGAPAAAMIGAEVAVFQLAGVVVERYGTHALAAHQVAMTIITTTFVVPLGVSQASAIRVASARVDAGSAGARRAGVVALGLASALAAMFAAALACAPDTLTRIFVDDQETAALARGILRVAALFLLFDAIQVVASGALRGLRDTRVPALVAVGAYVLVTPIAVAVATGVLGQEVVGIWIGLALGLAVVAVALARRFIALTR